MFSHTLKGRFSVILADPPWHFQAYTSQASGVPQRAAEQHYPTMTFNEMAAIPVEFLARSDAALFMWSTSSHTQQAFALAERWGFRFSSKAFCWAKLSAAVRDNALVDPTDEAAWVLGMGHGTRRQTEDCWLFRRGNPSRQDAGVRELVVDHVREHSRKPDEVYRRIERLYHGPYIELFARQRRPGWVSWGYDVDKFDAMPVEA